MAIIKCKMCGGDLVLEEGSNVAECEYCGSRQTVPSADNEKKLNLFARANRLRANNEFDKASGVYESIVADFPEEAEAYWGLILCKYGIEYVDDPGTGKKIPTCHRSSFDSLMDDQNFELVMEYADPIARRVYREEAKQIEELRKGIIEVSSREEPYDIFICYKETADDGQRTLDSVLAQDVYDMLIENGYRVFFSRVSLEDKLGVEYEPYIFAALNSAKIMLAFGTDYDYFNAVWVKNEWSRFLQLIAKGEKKTLIPCYKGIDAYDMPKEFAKLQAQDLGKVGANQDLLRGIKKILPKGDEKAASASQPVIQQVVSGSPNVAPLLRRAFMYLEDGEWQNADEYCEKVLDQEPENAEAYLGKLMAELKVRQQEDLRNCEKPFDGSSNYKKAVRFGGEKLAPMLKECVAFIKDRNETKRKTDIYNKAVSAMKSAKTGDAYQSAAKSFKTIQGFKDSEALAKQCIEKAAECRRIAEKNRRIAEENRRIAEEKNRRKLFALASAIKAGPGAKKEPTLEEKLSAKKARIQSLNTLRNGFDTLLAQATQLQQEQSALASQETNLSAQLSELTSQEKRLTTLRTKLGIFAGKEKKRIDGELSLVYAKKREASNGLSALAARKRELAGWIGQNAQQRCGFNTKEDLEREIAKDTAAASELETQIVSKQSNEKLTYSYEEAVKVYLREPEVSRAVNSMIYPTASQESVMFGKYVQKVNGAPEPIEWQVLERESDRIFVISKYALDCQQYNTSFTGVTWETCSLRKWLNEAFVKTAFTDIERSMIPRVTVSADRNPKYDTSPGNSTTDQVFLLSITEVNKYFRSDEARKCAPTDYAIAQGARTIDSYKTDGRATCWWWLRSPGSNSHFAANVNNDGSVGSNGNVVRNDGGAVRPALWINIGKLIDIYPLDSFIASYPLEEDGEYGEIENEDYSLLNANQLREIEKWDLWKLPSCQINKRLLDIRSEKELLDDIENYLSNADLLVSYNIEREVPAEKFDADSIVEKYYGNLGINLATGEAYSANKYGRPASFVIRDSEENIKIVIMVAKEGGFSHWLIKWCELWCRDNNVPFLRLYLGAPNTAHYIVRRVCEKMHLLQPNGYVKRVRNPHTGEWMNIPM